MLQFLPMLMKGAQDAMGVAGGAAGGAGGGAGGFMQMLGASGGKNKSSKEVGMQFANSGLQLPNTPSAQQMVAQMPQNMNLGQMQQGSMGDRQSPQTFNSLIQMLMNGGR